MTLLGLTKNIFDQVEKDRFPSVRIFYHLFYFRIGENHRSTFFLLSQNVSAIGTPTII